MTTMFDLESTATFYAPGSATFAALSNAFDDLTVASAWSRHPDPYRGRGPFLAEPPPTLRRPVRDQNHANHAAAGPNEHPATGPNGTEQPATSSNGAKRATGLAGASKSDHGTELHAHACPHPDAEGPDLNSGRRAVGAGAAAVANSGPRRSADVGSADAAPPRAMDTTAMDAT
jgi:hypothetical protein